MAWGEQTNDGDLMIHFYWLKVLTFFLLPPGGERPGEEQKNDDLPLKSYVHWHF